MKANCMVLYFGHTLETALNYFCRIPIYEKSSNPTNHNNENIFTQQLVQVVHKSYKLFVERFPNRNSYWNNVQQEDVRQDYKKTFDELENPIPSPKLKLNENNIKELLNDEDDDNAEEKIDEMSQHNSETISGIDEIIGNQADEVDDEETTIS